MENYLDRADNLWAEPREECFKIIDILQSYDHYLLNIKNWGATTIEIAATVGLANKTSIVFLLIAFVSAGFWLAEVRFKLLQLGHTLRATELEQMLQEIRPDVFSPRILAAFGEESRRNI